MLAVFPKKRIKQCNPRQAIAISLMMVFATLSAYFMVHPLRFTHCYCRRWKRLFLKWPTWSFSKLQKSKTFIRVFSIFGRKYTAQSVSAK